MAINFTVNGKAASTDAPPATPLLWVIREGLKLTGTKFGCGTGLCGACMVHIDGKRGYSCQTQVSEVAGKSVTTIEGLSPDSTHPLQKAWLAEQVPQCGYCQSGQIMSAADSAQAETEADPRRDRRAHEHEHLPLRHLSAHRARDRTRIAGGLSHDQAHPDQEFERSGIAPSGDDRRRRPDLCGCARWPRRARRRARGRASRQALSPWVSIAPDGTITIMSAATEMGQGSMTSLPLIIAEELDADWSKVRIVPAPPIEAIYGNPGFQGMMYTAGSNAVTSYYTPLRTFGAQVRRVLLDNAARKLGVPVEELTTEPSVVVHAKSGRKLSYGDIAAIAEVPAKAPEIKPEQLKKSSQFRLIGKDVMRVELPGKVNGSARYAIDVQVPNMLYGAVLRAPVEGSVPDKIDDSQGQGDRRRGQDRAAALWRRRARRDAMGGVRGAPGADSIGDLDTDRHGLGLRQRQGPRAVRRRRQEPRPWRDRMEQDRRSARRAAEGRLHHGGRVSLRLRLSRADGAAERHRIGVAGGRRGRDLGGTQSQTTATEAPAKILGIAKDKVKLHDMLMGGGFGRRGNRDVDFIIDAVLMSKEAGRPVKVMWTREDDVHNGRFRPISAHSLKAGFDASGKLTAWQHRIAVDRVGAYMDPVRYQMAGGKDFIAMLGADLKGYDVPHQLVEQLYRDTGVRTNPLRGISFLANRFATEAFVDEIARKRGKDPIAYHLELLKDTPRAVTVVKRVAADGGMGQETRRPCARLRLSRLFRLAGGRHRRSVARSGERRDQGA